MLSRLISDVAFAGRTLRKNPGFTTAALSTLAIGIGIAAAVFTVVNGVLIRPLPYDDPSRIEMIWLSSPRASLGREVPLSVGFFSDVESSQHSFSSVAAFQAWVPPMSSGDKVQLVNAAKVTPSLFATLGVHPALGRALSAEDAQVGAPGVVLISDALWRRRFGGDPRVVGTRIELEGRPSTVVGVMGPGFAFPRGAELPAYALFSAATDLWAPLVFTEADRREYRALTLVVIGRLRPGASIAQARADLAASYEISLRKQPPRNNQLTYDLLDMRSQAGRRVRGPLLFLLSASLFVLLIASANVTNLLVARTSARNREFAVRAALGAGQRRIARQLVTENLLLALIGSALGIAVSVAATRGMLALVPGSLPRHDDVVVDWRVLAASALLAAILGMALGVTSALQVRWRSLATTLRDAGTRSTTRRSGVGRSVLVVGEIALAVMLVIGASLLTTTFVRLQRTAPGFDADKALAAGVVLPLPASYADTADRVRFAAFYSQLVERLGTASGIRSAAATTALPLTATASRSGIRIANEPPPPPGKIPLSEFTAIEGPYFRTMGIRLVGGREFGPDDRADGAPVIVVNRQFERAYLDGSALGRQLLTPFDRTNGTVPRTVVGVVDDVSNSTLDDPVQPQVFLPLRQMPVNGLTIVLRTAGDPLGALATLTREVAALDRHAALGDVQTLRDVVARSFDRQRFAMTVMAVFAVAAVFLTVVGLYGVITLSVGERRREMGVRMALGATGRSVVALVLGQGLRMTAVGIALGLGGAFALNRFARAMLFGVSPTSAGVYAASVLLIAIVSLVAALAPALRASRLDPARVLRD